MLWTCRVDLGHVASATISTHGRPWNGDHRHLAWLHQEKLLTATREQTDQVAWQRTCRWARKARRVPWGATEIPGTSTEIQPSGCSPKMLTGDSVVSLCLSLSLEIKVKSLSRRNDTARRKDFKTFLLCLNKLITPFILVFLLMNSQLFIGYVLDGRFWDKFFTYIISFFKPSKKLFQTKSEQVILIFLGELEGITFSRLYLSK